MASPIPDPFDFRIVPGDLAEALPEFSPADHLESGFPGEFLLIPSLLDFLPTVDSFSAVRPPSSNDINLPDVFYPVGMPEPEFSSHSICHFRPEYFGRHCLRQAKSEFQGRVEALVPDLRRMLIAGDVQESRSKNPPVGMEQIGLKVCRYSPEEKKERIERYLKKKNLRNFNKTIKYACRKTLADSRQRIRGRFARNDDFQDTISTAGIEENHHKLKAMAMISGVTTS